MIEICKDVLNVATGQFLPCDHELSIHHLFAEAVGSSDEHMPHLLILWMCSFLQDDFEAYVG